MRCGWNRCPRCSSYGHPGGNFVRWNTSDYVNPYTLLDVKTQEPERTFPIWLEETYGQHHNCDEVIDDVQ
jgi:hypothetical protein